MGFKVNYKGLEVVVETIDDLDRLAVRAKATTNGGIPAAGKPPSGTVTIPRFVARLGDSQQEALRMTIQAGGSISRSDLMKRLEIRNTMSLSGQVTSPMQRRANREGFDLSSILRQDVREEDGEILFVIPENVIDEVGKGLKNIEV